MKISIFYVLVVCFLIACSEQYSTNDQSDKDGATSSDEYTNGSSSTKSRLVIECPVDLVNALPLDEEFGPGTEEITRCLENHNEIRVVYAINQACRTPDCNMAYGLNNINNAIEDYETTHDLSLHLNYDVTAVLYASGSLLAVDNNSAEPFAEINPFQELVESLIEQGVHVYLCQNSARHMGIVTANLIPGVEYVTSGVTAIADFQLSEYALINP